MEFQIFVFMCVKKLFFRKTRILSLRNFNLYESVSEEFMSLSGIGFSNCVFIYFYTFYLSLLLVVSPSLLLVVVLLLAVLLLVDLLLVVLSHKYH